jgi:hypothetical protein
MGTMQWRRSGNSTSNSRVANLKSLSPVAELDGLLGACKVSRIGPDGRESQPKPTRLATAGEAARRSRGPPAQAMPDG